MYSRINGCSIVGISACVPKNIDEVADFSLFDDIAVKKFIRSTGIERRRRADSDVCTSDLCMHAADKLLMDLGWERDSISVLVFVSQTADYRLPATSAILQHRLGLSTDCAAIDIENGCSGWIYGLQTAMSLLKTQEYKDRPVRALLLAGDTLLKICSSEDKSTYPLFGDAGTCTAIELSTAENVSAEFTLHVDGSGSEMIIVRGGGMRSLFVHESLQRKEYEPGICRNDLEIQLSGMDVFSFGITKGAECVNELIKHFSLDTGDDTLYSFHQANLMLNENIRRKLHLTPEQCPYCMREFGNTSSASVPLTLVSQCRERLMKEDVEHVACGFGVGASWGAVHFRTNRIVIPELLEV